MNNAFGVGQRVKVLVDDNTEHYQEIGTVNVVLNFENGAYEVKFGNGDLLRFDADELELAPAQPAPANRDTGWPQRDVDELGFSAMGLQPAASAPDDDEGEWLYPDGNAPQMKMYPSPQERIDALEAELAAAEYAASAIEGQLAYLSKQVVESEAELARVKAALEPFAAFGAEILTSMEHHANFTEGDDSITHGVNDAVVTLGDWRRAAQALQASVPAGGGEAWDDEHGGDYDDSVGGKG